MIDEEEAADGDDDDIARDHAANGDGHAEAAMMSSVDATTRVATRMSAKVQSIEGGV